MEAFLEGLEEIRPMAWPEPFEFWRESEGTSQHWRGTARSRGFETWEDWRRAYLPYFRMEERRWTLYRVIQPPWTVHAFRGGPFRGWIDRTYGDACTTPPFSDIVARLTEEQLAYVLKLKDAFPATTTAIGVLTDDGIVIAEGMHRCSALTFAGIMGQPIETDFRIALGSYLPGGVPAIPKIFKGVTPI